MSERSPLALLTIRAWCEDGSDDPLRAEIRLTTDVSRGFQHQLTVAQTEKVVEAVQAFLEEVVLAPRHDRSLVTRASRPGHGAQAKLR
jgi:hypothetical protein